mgnify:CR=1 FL=1
MVCGFLDAHVNNLDRIINLQYQKIQENNQTRMYAYNTEIQNMNNYAESNLLFHLLVNLWHRSLLYWKIMYLLQEILFPWRNQQNSFPGFTFPSSPSKTMNIMLSTRRNASLIKS